MTEDDANRALEWLASHAIQAAEARGLRYSLEEGRKRIKAVLMKEHCDLPISAQEREAYADPRYEEYVEGVRAAIVQDEKYRWLRDTAHARVEMYRTHSANTRKIV